MISNRQQYHLYHEGLPVLFHRFLGILIYWLFAFNQPLDWKRFIFRKWSYEIQLSYILMSSFQLCLSVLPINIVNNISSIFWIFKSQAWHSSIRSLWFFFFSTSTILPLAYYFYVSVTISETTWKQQLFALKRVFANVSKNSSKVKFKSTKIIKYVFPSTICTSS